MNLRITPQVILNQKLIQIQQEYARIGDLSIQASSGNRVNVVSDDPVDAIQAFTKQAQSARLDVHLENIQESQSKLDLSVSTLTETATLLAQARDIVIQGANSVNEPVFQQALANQVDALLDRVITLSNTRSGDSFLYGGTASQSAPFAVTTRDAAGHPTQVSYQGSNEYANILIGVNQTVDTLYPGNNVFQVLERGTTTYSGTTGAMAGTGTDSATGQGTLLVAHTLTTYSPGSGVQAGTSSVTGDTVLGLSGSHSLTVVDTSGTGASGTVSLDGGPAVNFTSADTDLRVVGRTGEVVFVNTTAITAGFNGTVNITGDGTLSVDGGITSVPINFTANQLVTDSVTGAVTNVDTSAVIRSGSDRINYPGTYDVFQILQAIRDDLRNGVGLTSGQQAAVLGTRITELDRVRLTLLNVVGAQSADQQAMRNLTSQIGTLQLQTKEDISNLQSADISEVVIRLQEQRNLLQVTLSSTARLFDLTLLNFLK